MIAFNRVGFSVGLLNEAKNATELELLGFHADKINLLADILKTERFSENYPKEDLQDCLDLRDEVDYIRVEKTDGELWDEVRDKYIIPAGRSLAKFTVKCTGEADMLSCLKGQERQAWQKLVEVLRGWSRTPHLPNLYEELAA